MPSSHLILCRPLLLLLPIPPSIRVFSNESTLRMRWPKYWSFSFSIIPLGANGESPVHMASYYTISISSEWFTLPSSLKDLSPVLFNSITLHFLFNTYHHLESSHHLFACLFIACLFIYCCFFPLVGRSFP